MTNYNPNDEGNTFKSLEGKILVASPHLDDAYFGRSVVYICAHDDNGAIGIIINQPIGLISSSELLRNCQVTTNNLAILGGNKSTKITKGTTKLDKKFPVLFGGPVNSDMVVALSISKQQERKFKQQHKVDLHIDVTKFVNECVVGKIKPARLILVKGISAWDRRQLDEEISDGTWLIADPSVDLLFLQRIRNKWDFTMRELGIVDVHKLVQYCGSA